MCVWFPFPLPVVSFYTYTIIGPLEGRAVLVGGQ